MFYYCSLSRPRLSSGSAIDRAALGGCGEHARALPRALRMWRVPPVSCEKLHGDARTEMYVFT